MRYTLKLPQRGFWRVCLVALLLVIPVSAQQPFVTDDTDTTPKRKFHFEFSNEFDILQRAAHPSIRQNTADFEIDYGLLDNLEIGFEVPVITIVNASGVSPKSITGIGDSNVSLKYNFVREREGSRMPAFAITMNLELPTGDTSRQLGSGLTDFYLNGVAQKSLTDKTKWRVNAGVLFSGNETTGVIGIKSRGVVFTGGTSLVRQMRPRFWLGAEVAGAFTGNSQLGKIQLLTTVGGNYQLTPKMTLDFGILAGKFSASPRVGVQLGFSYDF